MGEYVEIIPRSYLWGVDFLMILVTLGTQDKEFTRLLKAIDRERMLGTIKREKTMMDFFTGTGTGLVASCVFSQDSAIRTIVLVGGMLMIGIGWYKKAKYDKSLDKATKRE